LLGPPAEDKALDERVASRGEVDRQTTAAELKPARRIAVRRIAKWIAAIVIVAALAVFGWRYWRHSQLYVTTDDSYVNANVVQIAAQVSGPVQTIYVVNQQRVRAGDPLFQIDPRPFEIALQQAQANLALTRQQVSEEGAAVSAARAQLAQREAEYRNAEWNDQRTRGLIEQGYLSAQSGEATHSQAVAAAAAVRAAKANLAQAESALGTAGANNASIRAAEARVAQAQLDLERTRVVAPASGTIANLTLRPGAPVQTGAPLFSIVSNGEFWVDANVKETELGRIHPGQRATVTLDMYPNHPFEGEVESVSGGAGTAFSLLPPENATGNWVKVTQRVPVRVRIMNPDPRHPLRIGTTATVEIRVA
jgi:membrane fusion protein, multidrug efflux system